MTPTRDLYLGFQEQRILNCSESDINWYTDKIGGLPNWMYGSCHIPQCTECHHEMLLVTQLFCQLEAAFHRTLYIFTCISAECLGKSNSWRVLRSQLRTENDLEVMTQAESTEVKDTNVSANVNIWCDDADDWGAEDWSNDGADMETNQKIIPVQENCGLGNETAISSAKRNLTAEGEKLPLSDCTTHFEQMNIHESRKDSSLDDCGKSEPMQLPVTLDMGEVSNQTACTYDTSQSQRGNQSGVQMGGSACRSTNTNQLKQFISYYISTMAESLCEQDNEDQHVMKLLKQYERSEGSGYKDSFPDGDSGGSAEKYEKSDVKHGDKALYRFKKCLSVCPEQCLRYQWGGEPLLLSHPAGSSLSSSIPPCPICGECRVFELQLMPALAHVLKTQHSEECPVEFGTVLIFTCRQNCWQEGDLVKEEATCLMDYPDRSLFR